jgi:predicted HicB family RNase H-like nuclease
MTTEAPKRGRKPLPPGTTKDARIELRVHPDTKAAWQAKAEAAGLSMAAWIEATLSPTTKVTDALGRPS